MQMDNIYNLNITLFQNNANTLISYWNATAKTPSTVNLHTHMWHWPGQADEWAPKPVHGAFTLNLYGLWDDGSASIHILARHYLYFE